MENPNIAEEKCKLCGSSQYAVIYKANPAQASEEKEYKITDLERDANIRIAKCLRCGLVFLLDHSKENDIISAYERMSDELYLQEERGRRISAKKNLKKIIKLKRGGRLLDIGCSTEFFVDESRKLGYKAEGLEISSWAVKFAREKLKVNVRHGSILEEEYPYNYFDVIVMTDVIEHFADPLEVLTKVRRILKIDGLLYITTPDIDSALSRLLKAKWWGIKKSHLVYFSRKTMVKMLDRAGFNLIRVNSYLRTFSLDYWFSRLSLYNASLNNFSKILFKMFNKERLITINLYDQLAFFVRKKRSIEYIDHDEKVSLPNLRKSMKTIVVLPAYNAARTLAKTVNDIPKDSVDEIILVDDCSKDDTVNVAKSLGLKVYKHKKNTGYGGNQKTCYKTALQLGADIVVMIHPDYQYDPKIIPELTEPIKAGRADAVFGSRMMKGGALEGGMPLWKHNVNIILTALENVILRTYLTEFHSGFRAYSAEVLRSIRFELNSDNFVFDTEIIVQIILHHFKIEEVPIRTRYFDEASSIKFWPSILYGLGILNTLLKYILHENDIIKFKQFFDRAYD